MALWKIGGDKPQKVKQTQFKQEKLLEEHLEDWIQAEPTMLGEPLLIIGRQVMIPDTKDRLDLLAVDPQGQAVIIELKRGKLKDPVDIQALRYASYISKWKFEHFENVARGFLGKAGDPDFNFNETFETFCQESGSDEVPDLNEDQRVIIVGSSVRDKLGSVALWLRDHNVDIKLIEVTAYKEGEDLFIEPNVIVPIMEALNSAGVATYQLRPREMDPGSDEPGVRMGTMKRIKGLEFRAVAMACCDREDPMNHMAESNPLSRCERYVAATRAREALLITVAAS